MAVHYPQQVQDPLDTLVRMLNKTTLTTQRVSHDNIIDLGSDILSGIKETKEVDQHKAILQAFAAADIRATREIKASYKRAKQEFEEEKRKELEAQKLFYTRLATRVAEQRDQAEEERIDGTTRKLRREKEGELKKQYEELTSQNEALLEEARAEVRRLLRGGFAMEREVAIAKALKIQRTKHNNKERKMIAEIRNECKIEAQKEAERVAKLNKENMDKLNIRLNGFQNILDNEIQQKLMVIKDFKELQKDYKRFMNYTDGKFHSDYLMRKRFKTSPILEKSIEGPRYQSNELSLSSFP